MTGSSSVSYTQLHNHDIANLKTLFAKGFDLQTTKFDIINKYTIYKFNLYADNNNKDYNLWECIQVDFKKFEAQL